MRIRLAFLLSVFAIVSVACGSSLPPGVVEFRNPSGTFRVKAPEGWKTSPELMGFTAAQSPDGDMMFNLVTVEPSQAEREAYLNPREYTENGRTIIVVDSPAGGSGTFNGVTFRGSDMLHAFVSVNGKSYNVALQRATTVTKDPAHDQLLVDLASSFEPVQ